MRRYRTCGGRRELVRKLHLLVGDVWNAMVSVWRIVQLCRRRCGLYGRQGCGQRPYGWRRRRKSTPFTSPTGTDPTSCRRHCPCLRVGRIRKRRVAVGGNCWGIRFGTGSRNLVFVARTCQGGFTLRTRPMAVILARLFRRIIRITIVFTCTVRRARKWVGVVFATTMAAATTAALLALGGCMKLVGPSDGVRFGR